MQEISSRGTLWGVKMFSNVKSYRACYIDDLGRGNKRNKRIMHRMLLQSSEHPFSCNLWLGMIGSAQQSKLIHSLIEFVSRKRQGYGKDMLSDL